MNSEEIKEMQRRIGTTPDGFWGPKSIAACQKHVRALMPKPHPFPLQKHVSSFYGEAGDESNLVYIDFPYPMFYGGQRVTRTRVHRKCAESLYRVLQAIGKSYGQDSGIMEEASDYGGIFNFRNKRGSSSMSMHAWGIAIDLDADDNTFKDSWPMKSDMPLEIIEEFAKEGWLSAAVFWGYDAMHFQATQ